MNVRSMSGSPVVLAGLCAAALALFTARPAAASPTYPQLLQKDLGMPCAPPCTICHRNRNGGLYTVDKPFGLTMYAFGLRGQNPQSLKDAVAALKQNHPDSNGDGTSDEQELQDGIDPNTGGKIDLCTEGPVYGCGAHVAPRSRTNGLAAALAMLAGLVLLAGMRRRRS